MDNLQPAFIVRLSFQFLLQDGFVSGKEDVQVRIGGQCLKGPLYGCLRAMVAAETVYNDLYHTNFLT